MAQRHDSAGADPCSRIQSVVGEMIVRNENGWPITPVEEFSLTELIEEASRWAGLRYSTGTVGGQEFKKYNDELIRRGVDYDFSHIPYDPW